MNASVLNQIAALDGLSLVALKERWRELMGTDAPAYSRRLLIRRLAYRIQELAYGGLSEEQGRQMDEILQAAGGDGKASPRGRSMREKRKPGQPVPGTRLLREWRGQRHEVLVGERGFEFGGRRYRSLSAIANDITGTRWNGPAFFGLRGDKRKETAA